MSLTRKFFLCVLFLTITYPVIGFDFASSITNILNAVSNPSGFVNLLSQPVNKDTSTDFQSADSAQPQSNVNNPLNNILSNSIDILRSFQNQNSLNSIFVNTPFEPVIEKAKSNIPTAIPQITDDTITNTLSNAYLIATAAEQIPISELAQSFDTLRQSGVLKNYIPLTERQKAQSLPPEGTPPPKGVCYAPTYNTDGSISGGLTCCIPSTILTRADRKPPLLGGVNTTQCKATIMSKGSIFDGYYCATTQYTNSNCNLSKHKISENETIIEARLAHDENINNVICRCVLSKDNVHSDVHYEVNANSINYPQASSGAQVATAFSTLPLLVNTTTWGGAEGVASELNISDSKIENAKVVGAALGSLSNLFIEKAVNPVSEVINQKNMQNNQNSNQNKNKDIINGAQMYSDGLDTVFQVAQLAKNFSSNLDMQKMAQIIFPPPVQQKRRLTEVDETKRSLQAKNQVNIINEHHPSNYDVFQPNNDLLQWQKQRVQKVEEGDVDIINMDTTIGDPKFYSPRDKNNWNITREKKKTERNIEKDEKEYEKWVKKQEREEEKIKKQEEKLQKKEEKILRKEQEKNDYGENLTKKEERELKKEDRSLRREEKSERRNILREETDEDERRIFKRQKLDENIPSENRLFNRIESEGRKQKMEEREQRREERKEQREEKLLLREVKDENRNIKESAEEERVRKQEEKLLKKEERKEQREERKEKREERMIQKEKRRIEETQSYLFTNNNNEYNPNLNNRIVRTKTAL